MYYGIVDDSNAEIIFIYTRPEAQLARRGALAPLEFGRPLISLQSFLELHLVIRGMNMAKGHQVVKPIRSSPPGIQILTKPLTVFFQKFKYLKK